MNTKQFLLLGVAALAIGAFLTMPPTPSSAQKAATVAIDGDDIGGVVTQRQRAGGRRLGDRRDDRPADQVREDGRDRRSGPLRPARSAESQLSGLGARLRPRRLGQGGWRAGQAAQSDRGARAERSRRGASTIPRSTGTRCWKIPAEDNSAARAIFPKDHAGRLAEADEEHRLHRLSSARPASDAHHPGAFGDFKSRRRLDAPHPVRPVGRADDQSARRRVCRRAVQVSRRLDRPHRQRRAAVLQAAAPARRRAQHRRHLRGNGRRPTSISTT